MFHKLLRLFLLPVIICFNTAHNTCLHSTLLNSLHYFQIAVQTRQSSEGRPPKSLDVSSNASSQVMLLSNHMHGSRPTAVLTNDKYLKAVLYAERQGVAALRSVADMLRKSAEDSIKSMAEYQRVIDEANKNSF